MTAMTPEIFRDSLAAAKNGDETAFTVLFRYAQPAVLRYLRVIGRDRAEDLAGETWVQVVRGLGIAEQHGERRLVPVLGGRQAVPEDLRGHRCHCRAPD